VIEIIRDGSGRVIGFTEDCMHLTNVFAADTKFIGYSDGRYVYDASGLKVADNPSAIGVLLRGER
jgi:hypothetical protein